MLPRTAALGHQLLTAEEERGLGRAIEAGRAASHRVEAAIEAGGEPAADDVAAVEAAEVARQQFVESNLRLVLSIVGRYHAPAHVDRDDLIQDGMIGLGKAVDRFDWQRGFRFSTYAAWWIRQSIQRGLEHTSTTIRIPAHRRSELRMALRGLDGDPDRLDGELARVHSITTVDSIDRSVDAGDGELSVEIPCREPAVEEQVVDLTEAQRIHELLAELDPAGQLAMRMRFGLDGDDPATYQAIADRLGVTPEAARRRTHRALERLRELVEPLPA
ncbi:MAG: sigma-70 family RNA polymerase sigma factor [Actinomycetota bacterium]